VGYLRCHYATFAEVAIVNTVQGHIFFIEEDPSTRRAVANFFEEHNVPVCAVVGGHEFGRYVAGDSPSPIVFDRI
jgi:hypothetical protein